MKRVWIAIPTLTMLLLLAINPARGQEEAPKPEFDNAPVTKVLLWAQKSIGCGFVYEGDDLNDPETGRVRRITAKHVEPDTRAEKTLLLFELLKRAGLVAFEVGGLPGPTYQLHTAEGAARNAPLISHPDELGGLYFASLSIHLKRADVQSVAPRIRPKLTEGVGGLEVLEDTQSLIVTDFAERLRVAWEIVLAADEPLPRSDDVIVENFAVENGVASRFASGLERLRRDNEDWKLTVNETANVLLFSGQRAQIERVMERVRKLDAHPENPAFAEDTYTIKLIYIELKEGMNTLRDMFEKEIQAGTVQVGRFQRDRKIVFRGSKWDYERARATISAIDVKPDGE